MDGNPYQEGTEAHFAWWALNEAKPETVPIKEYERVIEENERLRSQIEEMRKALSDWYGAMTDGIPSAKVTYRT